MVTKPIRVLVASPLGAIITPVLAQQFETVTLVQSGEDVSQILPGSLRHDVAIIDLLWNSLDLEWTYDGFDAIEQLIAAKREAPVIIAAQGHGFERDYLQEAVHHRLVAGVLLKAVGFPPLFEAVETVCRGGRYWSEELPKYLITPAISVNTFLGSSTLTANVAGAIASGQAYDWTDVARLTGYSMHSVHKASDLFGEALQCMGEVDDARRVKQATVFRWCGEHARYIVSWCRRNGLEKYARSSSPLGQSDQ